MNIGQAITSGMHALGSESARHEVETLLCHVLGTTRAFLYANADLAVAADHGDRFNDLVRRRRAGEPIAYLVGTSAFWTLDLAVTPAVLIPRPETELLVEQALHLLPATAPARIADLGTGSGAIALSLASERPHWTIVATDISEAALQVARQNAGHHRLTSVEFRHGCWTEPLDGLFDLIVSNPPYIAGDDPHLDLGDCRFEPRAALTPGPAGNEHLRQVSRQALPFLQDGGWLLLEHGHDQGAETRRLLTESGFTEVRTVRDLAGHERVGLGRKVSR